MSADCQGFERILVATDFSPSAAAALRQAAWLARRNGARVALVHTIPDVQRVVNSSTFGTQVDMMYGHGDLFQREFRQDSETRLLAAVAALNAPELEISHETLLGEAFVELTHAVQHDHYDLVLAGSRGLAAWEQFFVGSTARRLIRKCPASVWVVRPEHSVTPRAVLAAVDFSEVSRKAALQGLWLAEQARADLHLLHVIDSKDVPDDIISRIPQGSSLREEINKEATRRLADFVESLPAESCRIVQHLSFGTPWKEIDRLSRKLSADVIAIGTIGRSGIRGVLLGNTAERVLAACECGILTVKPDGFVSPIEPVVEPPLKHERIERASLSSLEDPRR